MSRSDRELAEGFPGGHCVVGCRRGYCVECCWCASLAVGHRLSTWCPGSLSSTVRPIRPRTQTTDGRRESEQRQTDAICPAIRAVTERRPPARHRLPAERPQATPRRGSPRATYRPSTPSLGSESHRSPTQGIRTAFPRVQVAVPPRQMSVLESVHGAHPLSAPTNQAHRQITR